MKAANIDNFYLIPGKIMENDVNEILNDAEATTETNILKIVKNITIYFIQFYTICPVFV
jgi:hypothetical protein